MAVIDGRKTGRFFQAFYEWTVAKDMQCPHQSQRWRQPNPPYCSATRQFSTDCSRRNTPSGAANVHETPQRDGQIKIETNAKHHDRTGASAVLLRGEESREFSNVKEPRRTQTSAAAADLSHACRDVFRKLTHPVVVLTARDKKDTSSGKGQLRGVTVSSFTSITLEPSPYVCFNLKLPSRTWDAMMTCPLIIAHILPGDAQGARVAHLFTRPHADPAHPFSELERIGENVDYQDKAGPPTLCRDDRIVARLTAEVDLEKCTLVGDHALVVAKVVNVQQGTIPGHAQNVSALSYGARGYRMLGEILNADESQIVHRSHGARQDMPAFGKGQRRSYSTRQPGAISRILHGSDDGHASVDQYVTDRSLLKLAVREFLGEMRPKEGLPPIRLPMRTLLNLREEIEKVTKEQEQLMAADPENTIERDVLQRRLDALDSDLTRVLARRSAGDLNHAMDRGSVDFRLTQWQEKIIEKAQLLLLHQARGLRERLQSRDVTQEEFKTLGQSIKSEYDALCETTIRLKALLEEEDDY